MEGVWVERSDAAINRLAMTKKGGSLVMTKKGGSLVMTEKGGSLVMTEKRDVFYP